MASMSQSPPKAGCVLTGGVNTVLFPTSKPITEVAVVDQQNRKGRVDVAGGPSSNLRVQSSTHIQARSPECNALFDACAWGLVFPTTKERVADIYLKSSLKRFPTEPPSAIPPLAISARCTPSSVLRAVLERCEAPLQSPLQDLA